MALGLPALVQKLQLLVPGAAAPPKKRAKPAPKKPRVKAEPAEAEAEEVAGGARRSRRLREVASKPKVEEETAEAKFERQLGEFIVDGECPKCGKILEKGHRAHLRQCGGPRAAPGRTAAT